MRTILEHRHFFGAHHFVTIHHGRARGNLTQHQQACQAILRARRVIPEPGPCSESDIHGALDRQQMTLSHQHVLAEELTASKAVHQTADTKP